MAKSKYAPALFEVIGQTDEKSSGRLSLPTWWRSKGTSAPSMLTNQTPTLTPPTNPVPSAEQAETAPPVAGMGENPSPDTSVVTTMAPVAGATVDLDGDNHAKVRIREGRVELRLNATNVAIVAGALVLGLFLAYQVGRGFSSSGKTGQQVAGRTNDLEEARNKPANPTVLNTGSVAPVSERSGNRSTMAGSRSPAAGGGTPAGNSPAKARTNVPIPGLSLGPAPAPTHAPAPEPAASGARTPGLTYVVLEGNIKHEDKPEAEQICQWLKSSQGIETTVESSGDRWEIVSTQGYDYNNEAEKQKCNEFRSIVKELGKKYKAEFGVKASYLMRDPGLKKLKK